MIPTIEDIVAGLLAGTYTREQAIGWLHEHRKLAALPAPEAVSVPVDELETLQLIADSAIKTRSRDVQDWIQDMVRVKDKVDMLLAARSARDA